MDAGFVYVIDGHMTPSTCFGYILLIGSGEGIVFVKDIMITMTILTGGRFGVSQRSCHPVHALLILPVSFRTGCPRQISLIMTSLAVHLQKRSITGKLLDIDMTVYTPFVLMNRSGIEVEIHVEGTNLSIRHHLMEILLPVAGLTVGIGKLSITLLVQQEQKDDQTQRKS